MRTLAGFPSLPNGSPEELMASGVRNALLGSRVGTQRKPRGYTRQGAKANVRTDAAEIYPVQSALADPKARVDAQVPRWRVSGATAK